jgi:glycosyltransferase involved in cell wall biosynthesis
MSRAARAKAVARFDLEVVASQWEDVYRELLSGGGGAPWM